MNLYGIGSISNKLYLYIYELLCYKSEYGICAAAYEMVVAWLSYMLILNLFDSGNELAYPHIAMLMLCIG